MIDSDSTTNASFILIDSHIIDIIIYCTYTARLLA